VILLLALMALASVRQFYGNVRQVDRLDNRRTAWLEQLGHDDSMMLVAPPHFLDYVLKHHPVQWAFVPANDETLALLAASYPIGTLLLSAGELDRSLSSAALAQVGLEPIRRVNFGQEWYWLFRRFEPKAES
jgi:hypothetical protein